jgi:hypothetical protein
MSRIKWRVGVSFITQIMTLQSVEYFSKFFSRKKKTEKTLQIMMFLGAINETLQLDLENTP